MFIPPFIERCDTETQERSIVLLDLLPDQSTGGIHIEFHFDARLDTDYLGECLTLSFIDEESEFSILDIMLTEVSQDIRNKLLAGGDIQIIDPIRNVEMTCRLPQFAEV